MSEKYNEEAEDLMFELFDEDDFTKVISFVDIYGCDFVDRDGRHGDKVWTVRLLVSAR